MRFKAMDQKTPKVEFAPSGRKASPGAGQLKHELPPLPYDYAALEPHIDARTMMLHHDKHHASYVDKLNAALEPYAELRRRSMPWLLLNIESVPEQIRTAVHNNTGGHLNHCLFWRGMAPDGGGLPSGVIAAAIDAEFGSFEQFKTQFDEAGGKVFGSGWVWLVSSLKAGTKKLRLEIVTTPGHDNPLQKGSYPLMVNDVWEHAYYLKYENRRPDYLKKWWSVVNWKEVSHRFENPHESTDLEPADGFLVPLSK
jgi:superoxide dismutase, Fe-Mn family